MSLNYLAEQHVDACNTFIFILQKHANRKRTKTRTKKYGEESKGVRETDVAKGTQRTTKPKSKQSVRH